MNMGRVTKVIAVVLFLLAAFGLGTFPYLLIGLALWALGEAV